MLNVLLLLCFIFLMLGAAITNVWYKIDEKQKASIVLFQLLFLISLVLLPS